MNDASLTRLHEELEEIAEMQRTLAARRAKIEQVIEAYEALIAQPLRLVSARVDSDVEGDRREKSPQMVAAYAGGELQVNIARFGEQVKEFASRARSLNEQITDTVHALLLDGLPRKTQTLLAALQSVGLEPNGPEEEKASRLSKILQRDGRFIPSRSQGWTILGLPSSETEGEHSNS